MDAKRGPEAKPAMEASHEPEVVAEGARDGAGVATAQLIETIKETSCSVIIAFVLAFVFRGFVIEAFVIPTGSMAPTLMGSHMRFTSEDSGYSWAVGPWDIERDGMTARKVQGASGHAPISVHDPMTGRKIEQAQVPIRWGDRIFVLKYLYSLNDPNRFDVVVFKNPRNPTVNYIKRLLGLPGEMVALVDGDVFVRRPSPQDPQVVDGNHVNQWALPGWKIARKPERAQRAMWQQIFSSEYEPRDDALLPAEQAGLRGWVSPWIPVGQGEDGQAWKRIGRGGYANEGTGGSGGSLGGGVSGGGGGGGGGTLLEWNSLARPIMDSYAYNESPVRASREFPVSDLRLTASWVPKDAQSVISGVLTARGHTYVIRLGADGQSEFLMGEGTDKRVTLRQMEMVQGAKAGKKLALDTPHRVEFWFVDQTLQLWMNDELLGSAAYEWDIRKRVESSIRGTLEEVMMGPEYLTEESNYVRPRVWFAFEGGKFEVMNVGLWRDIHYQADTYRLFNENGQEHSRAHQPAQATHPMTPLMLDGEEFFACGDNSPQSLDGRLLDKPHPWVERIDPDIGVIHRDLLIGRAFFVYFPSPYRRGQLPVPDVGKMRWIW